MYRNAFIFIILQFVGDVGDVLVCTVECNFSVVARYRNIRFGSRKPGVYRSGISNESRFIVDVLIMVL
jgi:hypothetical protein